jgi:tRNA-dihydrouridine synthase A
LNQAFELSPGVDGVMLGRAAYHNAGLLVGVDRLFYGDASSSMDWTAVRDAMMQHAARHIAGGGRLVHVTRHMVGLFHGMAGAKRYRQILSTKAPSVNAGPDVIAEAFSAIRFEEQLVA